MNFIRGKTSSGFCPRSLALKYYQNKICPPFLLLLSSVLYSLPLIFTVHVQIQIDSVDTCPISPSLKFSGVVVRLKSTVQLVAEHLMRRQQLSPRYFQAWPLSCSFLILILFHGMVWCVALNGKPYPPSLVLLVREQVLPWTTPEVILIGFHFFAY